MRAEVIEMNLDGSDMTRLAPIGRLLMVKKST